MSLSASQDKFCANIVRGMTKKGAYLDAFPSSAETSAAVLANKLLKKPDIMARIDDIRASARAESNTTIHSIIDELEEARQVAKTDKNAPNMMRASMLKAQVLGFLDKELGPGLNVGTIEQLTVNEIKDLKNKIMGDE